MANERNRQAVKIVDPLTDANEASVDAAGNLQVIEANLPVAAALTDNFANPTTTQIAAMTMLWDGATWDRAPGDLTDGLLVNLGANNDIVADVQGVTAADAPLTVDPVTVGGRASTAIPTAVSADGDVVNAWLDRQGAQKMVIVDDAGDSAMDGTNNALNVNIVAGAAGGVTHVDNAAFTEDVDDGVPAFGLFHDVTPPLITEGRAGIIRASANRNLYETIRDAAGNERGVNVTAANELNVIATAQPGVDIGDVDVLSVIPGVAATELGKAIDTAVGATDTGVGALVERRDTPVGLTPADGDWTSMIVDANGRLHVTDPNAGAGTPTTPTVDRPALAAIAAGAVSLGTELRTSDLGGLTRQLSGINIGSSAPYFYNVIREIDDAETILDSGFGPAGSVVQWRPPHKAYFNEVFAANAGFDGWRVEMENLDTSQTTDFFSTFFYEA